MVKKAPYISSIQFFNLRNFYYSKKKEHYNKLFAYNLNKTYICIQYLVKVLTIYHQNENSMPDSFNNLDKYIQKLLEIQDKKEQEKITEQQMKEIAAEMGLSDMNWQEVQNYAKEHFTRGNGYAKYKNWTDAIYEFEQSKAIMPNNVELCYALANAHYQKWLNKGDNYDKDKAQKYALKCLRLNPEYDDAFKLITQLKTKRWLGMDIQQWQWIGISALLLVILTGYWLYPSEMPVREPIIQNTPPVTTTTDNSINTNTTATTANNTTTTVTYDGIPIEFKGKELERFEIEIDEQDFSSYSSNANYTVSGYFKAPKHDVLNLKIKVTIFNNKGEIINEALDDALKKDYHPIARAGDNIPFHVNIYGSYINPPPLSKVTIDLLTVETEEPPSRYEASDKVKVRFEPKRPKNVDISVLARKNLQTFSKYLKRIEQKNTFEIKNTGNVVIKQMKGRVDWYDNNGQVFSSSDADLIYNFLPSLGRNETRVTRFEGNAEGLKPENVDYYELVITEVDF